MIPGKQKYLQLSYINAILKQSLKENCYAVKRKNSDHDGGRDYVQSK
ncbi:hypothetical protein ROSEINA2194_00311 [Roseburia inulinivorans DSM 16841]|uniref:Uncharacterized protein n=1 Tax=Roseburia inulinivorans DSM 16841 TaxID=622312 RepID=C0FNL2_9FIRM|nr:hypothetical protein ROSEINA2194_00311 [Roseburia inulinivorans DSM 16841]